MKGVLERDIGNAIQAYANNVNNNYIEKLAKRTMGTRTTHQLEYLRINNSYYLSVIT